MYPDRNLQAFLRKNLMMPRDFLLASADEQIEIPQNNNNMKNMSPFYACGDAAMSEVDASLCLMCFLENYFVC